MNTMKPKKAAKLCGDIEYDLMEARDGPNGGRVDYSTYELAAGIASKRIDRVYEKGEVLQSFFLRQEAQS